MIHRLAISALALGCVAASLGCSSTTTSPSAEPTGTAAAAFTVRGGPHLLWQNRDTGDVGLWALSGTAVTIDTPFTTQQCGDFDAGGCAAQWQPVDTLALGTGSSILWWNKSTGHIRTWNMDSSGNVTIPSDPTQTCGTSDGCVVAGVHDWRPIGRVTLQIPPPPGCTGVCFTTPAQGLLWHDPVAGTVRVWVFDSSGQVQGTYDLTQTCGSALSCSQSWTARVTADFDGDGTSDLLWWNATSGVLREWLLNSPSSLSPIPATVSLKGSTVDLSATCEASNGCSSDWRLVGAADVNGDSHVDLLWHNNAGTYPGAAPGTLRNWLLNGSGGVTGTQDLSAQCGPSCSPPWIALGYVSFNSP